MTSPRRSQTSATAPRFRHDGIAFGCDYNPEQWDPSVWPEDIALMREAGVDLVAINIFGWSQVEPRAGEYDFRALDSIIELLHDAGIGIDLGTATSSPPPWLSTLHPEILPIAEDGTTRFPGGRQAWCPSSPVFRERALALVEQIVIRYGAHPAIKLWHVSNELGCHNALCYCDTSTTAFRGWLERKYGTLDALNRAWGTTFWSQRYSAWNEILTPRLTLSTRNPGQLLDFHRFSSDELLDHFRAERDVIRRHSALPVTTNFMVEAHIRNLDYWRWAGEMDVISNDHYLDHRLGDPIRELAFSADVSRGLAGGDPWLLLEQSTGAVNWQPVNHAKAPGELTRNSLTHVARGADAVCFFQWRASQQGAEKFHSALLPHAGTESAVWREVVELGGLIDRIGEVAGSRVVADVALMFSWDSNWAADSEMRPTHEVTVLDQVLAVYGALHSLGITVDVIAPGADLSGYRLVVVPGLYSVTDQDAAALDDWVSNGGSALITFFSGIADEDDRVRLGGYPGAFRDLLGVRVEEFAPLAARVTAGLASGATATVWTERMTATTATVIDTWVDGPSAGMPAVTRNDRGAGAGWYVSTMLDAEAMRATVARAAVDAGVTVEPKHPAELELIRRSNGDASWLFAINHGATPVIVDARGEELVTGASVAGAFEVPAGAVAIVREVVQ